jgi:hypothetical protein
MIGLGTNIGIHDVIIIGPPNVSGCGCEVIGLIEI